MKGKTAIQVEDYFYATVKNSALASVVNGGVYRDGYRPENSQKEDIVIIHTTGTADFVQRGIVNINIYVPNILLANKNVANKARLKIIEAAANDFVDKHSDSNYLFELGNIIQSIQEEDINQYFVSVRIKYTLINN